jgi:hypothetical protein
MHCRNYFKITQNDMKSDSLVSEENDFQIKLYGKVCLNQKSRDCEIFNEMAMDSLLQCFTKIIRNDTYTDNEIISELKRSNSTQRLTSKVNLFWRHTACRYIRD